MVWQSLNIMRKRTTDVTIAFIFFLLCCLLSFLEKSDWWADAFATLP